MKLTLTFCILLFVHGKSVAQYFFAKEYSPFSAELNKAIRYAHGSGIKSLTATYRMDNPKSGDKGKLTVTFLNDSVFELKDHEGKEQYVFRGKSWYWYAPDLPVVKPALIFVDSADCQVIRGTPNYDDSSQFSYCRFQRDSLGRRIDYYFTAGKIMKHETWVYEGDSAYWHDAWQNNGDSLMHVCREYVYLYYNSDSSFYTRAVKHFRIQTGIQFPNGEVHESTRTYVTYDELDRVKEIRIENAEATDGRASPGMHVHVMKIAYKSR